MEYEEEKDPDADEESDEPSDKGDPFREAIEDAFPDEDWDDSRVAAFKDAIRICAEKDYGDEDGASKKPPKGKAMLALLALGKPKRGE